MFIILVERFIKLMYNIQRTCRSEESGIGQEEGNLRFPLENNGRAPAQPIRESGGLLSLRALTESKGGSMAVESDPAFRLTIVLPDRDA